MQEQLFLNNSPLNQTAKRFLLQEKEQADPSVLYCLQLAKWGLEKGKLAIDYQVEESLNVMLREDPAKVMKLLEMSNPQNPQEHFNLLSGQKEPQDLAWAVLDRLREILSPSLGLIAQPSRD